MYQVSMRPQTYTAILPGTFFFSFVAGILPEDGILGGDTSFSI